MVSLLLSIGQPALFLEFSPVLCECRSNLIPRLGAPAFCMAQKDRSARAGLAKISWTGTGPALLGFGLDLTLTTRNCWSPAG
jgi:hypothetical protein